MGEGSIPSLFFCYNANMAVNNKKRKLRPFIRETLEFLKELAVCMLIVFIVGKFIVQPIEVKGSSMYPTLQDGSYGITNVIGRRTGHIERFDIAIIYIKDRNEYLVKRVVGLPGETISYTDGVLYVDGAPVNETFFDEAYVSTYGADFMRDIEPVTLKEDEYYCLGDNRPHSSDSRVYGPFKEDVIVAKGALILFPLAEFGVRTW